jgi:Anti-sigma factor NepR
MSMPQNPDQPIKTTLDGDNSSDVPELDAQTQSLLGQALQAHYDDLVNSAVPDRFLVLLAQIEAKEKRDE